ncbi:MAG: Pr6Pr family membrane protein [Geodermatophilaceae bacterium]|nr:Pr6Pr family membrane protein [Geodermatophilaceae bacterium]
MTGARWWHLLTAAVSGSALVLQLAIVLASDNDTAIVRLVRLLSFFTIQSNIIVTAVALTLVIRPDRDGQLWQIARLAALVCITVTGIVYVTVLRGLVELTPAGRVADTGLHYLTPLLVVVGWLAFGPRPRIGVRVIVATMLYPALWLAYTLSRGELTDEYPYPFVDVTAEGYAAVALNCVVVTALFLAVAGIYLWLDTRLRAAPSSPAGPRATPARRRGRRPSRR